jgi:hypothetical protein
MSTGAVAEPRKRGTPLMTVLALGMNSISLLAL